MVPCFSPAIVITDFRIEAEESECRGASCGAKNRRSNPLPSPHILDFEFLSDTVFDMKISTRSLVREFPRIKAAARKGQKVEIYDGRTGEAFFLTAKPKETFGELAEMAKGVYSGPRDLSSREGFDA